MKKTLPSTAILLAGALLASSCSPAPIVAARMLEATEIPEMVMPATDPILLPDPDQSLSGGEPADQLPVFPATQDQPVIPAADAVQLDLPADLPSNSRGWRPALYPVPWAAGPEDHFYFTRPILADSEGWLLDDYKYGYIYEGFDNVHTGIDIDAAVGTPVYAAASGKVIWAGYGLLNGHPDPDDPYGLAIAIRHDFGFKDQRMFTLYAHLSAADVHVGDLVEIGQTIGLVGTTGATTGPHLHFEVREGINDYFASRNPELWLAPAQGWGVIAAQIYDTAGRPIKSKQVYVTNLETAEEWTAITYAARAVNSDDYYRENMVLSDLPGGRYLITFDYLYQRFSQEVDVLPGRITYFRFQGRKGFSFVLPAHQDPALQPATP